MKRVHGNRFGELANGNASKEVEQSAKAKPEKQGRSRKPSNPAKSFILNHHTTHANSSNEINDILAKAISINLPAFPG